MPGLIDSRRARENTPRGLLARRNERLRRRNVTALEDDLGIIDRAEGLAARAAGAVLSNSVVQSVFDVASRPNFAMVALTEGLLGGDPKKAIEGAAREFFSGIGGIKGRKRDFNDLLTSRGFGTGGSLSGLIPIAFSDTGRGIQFKRGGFFDWTARGSLGLGLDIATDPLTYLTLGAGAVAKNSVRAGRHFLSEAGEKALKESFGRQLQIRAGKTADKLRIGSAETFLDADTVAAKTARDAIAESGIQREAMEAARSEIAGRIDAGDVKLADQGGIKMFGKTIVPGRTIAAPVENAWAATVRFLDKTSTGSKVVEIGRGLGTGLGKIFSRDFLIRRNEAAKVAKQNYLDRIRFSKTLLRDNIESVFRGVKKSDRVLLTRHIDNPAKHALPDHLKPVADKVQELMGKMADAEVERNLLDVVRTNYILHAYKDSPEKVKKVLDRLKIRDAPLATLRGSQKERAFDVLDEAIAAGLHPIDDAAELLNRRGLRHIEAVEAHDYFDEIRTKFGHMPEKAEATEATDLLNDLRFIDELDEADAEMLLGLVGKKGVKLDEVRKLSDAGKAEFLRRRFAAAKSGVHIEKIKNKYAEFEELFPEATSLQLKTTKTFDGQDMALVEGIPALRDVYLPSDIAEDVGRFNENFINLKEVRGLLRAYDVLLNRFKISVTSFWPAFHIRNAYSNVVQQFTDIGLNALNPAMHGDALRILLGNRTGAFKTKLGETVTYNRAVLEMQQRNVLTDYRSVFEVTDTDIPIRIGARKIVNAPARAAKGTGAFIENEARVAQYIALRRRGLSPDDAANRVKRVLFDYTNISKAERDVLTRLIPFYRWTRKNLALQVERAVKNPGQLVAQAKLTRQQSADPATLPKFLRGSIAFQLEADEAGNIKTVSGIDFPISDLNLIFNDRAEDFLREVGGPSFTPGGVANVALASMLGVASETASMMTPLLKVPVELVADRDFFRGGRISDQGRLRGVGPALEQFGKLPGGKALLKWMDFQKLDDDNYRVNPTKAYIFLKSYVLARGFSTAERMMSAKDADLLGKLADPSIIGGLRFNDVNVSQATRTIEREYEDILEQIAIAKGKRRRFTKTFKPKEEGGGTFKLRRRR